MMTGSIDSDAHLKQYLQQLTPQVRGRLLAELERLHRLGEDIPHSESMIAALRAEFRNTGHSHYRVGNPSRYFFEPLEPVLMDGAPEHANSGQIARGSLGPIWSLITEKLLPSMAGGYVEGAGKAIAVNNQVEARHLADSFQNKAVTYLDGVLARSEGVAEVHTGLECYTSSRATFDDLTKMLCVMHGRHDLAAFARALPTNIASLDGDRLAKVLELLNGLRSARADLVPFALTVIARRLETPWHLMHLATKPAASRTAAKIASMPYAIAVSMVLDQIDERRLMLTDALKHSRIPKAKEILTEIHAIDAALKAGIDLDGSAWAVRLDQLMQAVDAALDAEISSIPSDHQHLIHTLETFRLKDKSQGGVLGGLVRKGRDLLMGWRHEASA